MAPIFKKSDVAKVAIGDSSNFLWYEKFGEIFPKIRKKIKLFAKNEKIVKLKKMVAIIWKNV